MGQKAPAAPDPDIVDPFGWGHELVGNAKSIGALMAALTLVAALSKKTATEHGFL
jgi:hypothetical protein